MSKEEGGKVSSLVEGAANATAKFGGGVMAFSAVLSILAGIAFAAGAIFVGTRPQQVMVEEKATIKEAECNSYQSCSSSKRSRSCRTKISCVVAIEYPDEDGNIITKGNIMVDRSLSVGQVVDIKYPSGNPLEACIDCNLTNTQWALILGGVSAFLFVGGGVTWYFRRFKAARAFSGGAVGLGMMKRAF